MSHRKKKDQKRERLQRAAKKREHLDARREAREQAREERRLAGLPWLERSELDELFSGSLLRRGQAWCGLGFVISMLLMFVLVLPAQLLSGQRSATPVFYFVMLLLAPSFVGTFVFMILEQRLKRAAFGRGQDTHETLEVVSSRHQTKEIKEHTAEILRIGPTIRERVAAVLCLGLPAIWYAILLAAWLLLPDAFENADEASVMAVALPFILPLPFVVIGILLLSLPRTFVFDRKSERLYISNWWQKSVLLLSEVQSLQIIEGHNRQERHRRSGRLKRGSYSTVQLNLVMSDPQYPRINISNDGDRNAIREMAPAVAGFLDVPLHDIVGLIRTPES